MKIPCGIGNLQNMVTHFVSSNRLRFLNGGVLRNLNMHSFQKLYSGSSATWLSESSNLTYKRDLYGKIWNVLAYGKGPNRQGTSATKRIAIQIP